MSTKRVDVRSVWMVEVKYPTIGWFPIYNQPGCVCSSRAEARAAAREQVEQHKAEEYGPRRVTWDVRVREYYRLNPYRKYKDA